MFPYQGDTNIHLTTVWKQWSCVSMVKALSWGMSMSSSYPVVHVSSNFLNCLVRTWAFILTKWFLLSFTVNVSRKQPQKEPQVDPALGSGFSVPSPSFFKIHYLLGTQLSIASPSVFPILVRGWDSSVPPALSFCPLPKWAQASLFLFFLFKLLRNTETVPRIHEKLCQPTLAVQDHFLKGSCHG